MPPSSTEYKFVNGTQYPKNTPNALVEVLERLRQSMERVAIYYGDPKTGKEEEGVKPDRGHIGRTSGSSDGTNKVLVIFYGDRSTGGLQIDPQFIVRITASRGGKLIWQRHTPTVPPATPTPST